MFYYFKFSLPKLWLVLEHKLILLVPGWRLSRDLKVGLHRTFALLSLTLPGHVRLDKLVFRLFLADFYEFIWRIFVHKKIVSCF